MTASTALAVLSTPKEPPPRAPAGTIDLAGRKRHLRRRAAAIGKTAADLEKTAGQYGMDVVQATRGEALPTLRRHPPVKEPGAGTMPNPPHGPFTRG